MPTDPRRHAPATLRNRDPIRDVLRDVLPSAGSVLEIASGTGEHIGYFAAQFPTLRWQPSDRDADALAGIDAHVAAAGPGNVARAILLDAAAPDWPVATADAILCINMIHIAPWTAGRGLLRGAGRTLPSGGPLILYGPFMRGGRHTGPGNVAFDRALRAENPAWGIRDLDAVDTAATEAGLRLDAVVAMPADNLTVVFRKS